MEERRDEVVDVEAKQAGESVPAKSKSRATLNVVLIIFFVALTAVAVGMATLAFRAAEVAENTAGAIEPIGDRMRSLFVGATPVILPNPSTIVREINDLARLETASYELEKVITADSGQDGLLEFFVGESMVFVANGKVFAGVDLATMTPEDLVVVDPDTVMVRLPAAEIFDDIPVLNNEKSYVADRDTGLLTQADEELETRVRQTAEQAIREAAEGSDILDRANFNAQAYMSGFLEGLGFTEVIFTREIPTNLTPYEQPLNKGQILLPTATPAPSN